jgi:hypothetical protein
MSKQKRWFLLVVTSTAVLLALLSIGVFGGKYSSKSNLSDEEAIRLAYTDVVGDSEWIIVDLEIDNGWAVAGTLPTDPETGETLDAGPGLVIFKKRGNNWKGALLGSSDFKNWLEDVPENLISSDTKNYLLETYYSRN